MCISQMRCDRWLTVLGDNLRCLNYICPCAVMANLFCFMYGLALVAACIC